jgi:serine/threonine-protein kinase
LTESLIDELGAVKQLTVISRNGVAPFKGKNVPTDSIQRALKVGTIVSGSVAQSGDQLRVKVQLVDAANGNQIASQTFDKPRTDLFALQDTLAKEVSLALRKQLGNEIEAVTARPSTKNAQAWEALQQVKQTLAGFDSILTTGGPQQALQVLGATDNELNRIAAMDSKWAAPIALRGFNYVKRVVQFANVDSLPKWFREASKDADQVLALSPNDPDGLELRGTIRYFMWSYNQTPDPTHPRKMLEDAEADFRASLAANPLQTTALNGLSYVLNSMNRFSDAKLAAEQAYKTDPYLKDINKTIWRLFQNSIALNNRTESERWCNIGRQKFPNDYRFTECRLWLYELPGQKVSADSVWKAYRDFIAIAPASRKEFHKLRAGMMVALALLRTDVSPDSARHVAERSRGNPQDDPAGELFDYEAQFRAQVGDKDDAIKRLSQFFANNPPLLAFAKDDESWWLEPVRTEPRYKSLVGATN